MASDYQSSEDEREPTVIPEETSEISETSHEEEQGEEELEENEDGSPDVQFRESIDGLQIRDGELESPDVLNKNKTVKIKVEDKSPLVRRDDMEKITIDASGMRGSEDSKSRKESKSPLTVRHRRSKTSNYSTLTGHKEKPLPFNAVRYIGNMLKELKNGIQEDKMEMNSNKSFGQQ